jgi:hypothetical protein
MIQPLLLVVLIVIETSVLIWFIHGEYAAACVRLLIGAVWFLVWFLIRVFVAFVAGALAACFTKMAMAAC